MAKAPGGRVITVGVGGMRAGGATGLADLAAHPNSKRMIRLDRVPKIKKLFILNL